MFEGVLEAIFVARRLRAPMERVGEVRALAGRGLEGDRYCAPQPGARRPGSVEVREVTLIEAEAVEAYVSETGTQFEAALSRRNLVTRGVPLNHLVGRRIQVGEVVLEGTELCEPCGHLERLTVRGVQKGLCHRGGLRARIVVEGLLRAGDVIRPCDLGQKGDE
jgi:MOSC domain-containing protein YiiM